jgi:hypothetical protein
MVAQTQILITMKTYAFIIKRDQSIYPSGYANGYVAITKEHPLYKKNYSDLVTVESIDDVPYNGNILGALVNSFNADRKENEIPLDLAIDVHCGLTLSDKFERLANQLIEWLDEEPTAKNYLWVFGFDTAHSGDSLATWPKEKVIEETLKLQSILENWK